MDRERAALRSHTPRVLSGCFLGPGEITEGVTFAQNLRAQDTWKTSDEVAKDLDSLED